MRFGVICPLDAALRDNATVVGLEESLACTYTGGSGTSDTYIHNGIILFRFPRFSHLRMTLGEIHTFRRYRVSKVGRTKEAQSNPLIKQPKKVKDNGRKLT